ncbi:flagellar basal body P-ring formation chaperone FlgA [Pseudovibrio flavus]|uniref:flagellar basal body P-ring formation chaperone FlgA n=1 Tax=Pseudovibrio flavus TaxID=2529854 RepID=UPI003529460C
MKSVARKLSAVTLVVIALSNGATAFAQSKVTEIPVPNLVIYPGDLIEEGMLTQQRVLKRSIAGMPIHRHEDAILGKEAKRTLIPGHPIALNATREPLIVRRGTLAKLIFREDGLEIIAVVEPLQSGAVGETVKAKNLDTGLQVVGVVQEDGTLLVEGG